VSLTPVVVDIGGNCHHATSINDTRGTGGKFATCVVDTGGAP
jgi:hypothetical protein